MSRRAIALVGLLMLAAALGYVDRQAVVAVSPKIVKEFGLTDEQWGWTNSAFALVYVPSSILGGIWIDRIGLKRGLAISLAFWSVAAAGHALATDFWTLCLWRMLLALGEGPGFAGLLKGIRRLMPLHLRDTGSGLISASTVLGAMVAPWIVIPLMEVKLDGEPIGWRAAFVVTAASGLIWLLAWFVLARGEGDVLGPRQVKLETGTNAGRLNWRSFAVWAAVLTVLFTVPPTVFVTYFLPRFLETSYGVSQGDMKYWLWQVPLVTDVGQVLGGVAASALLARGWSFLGSRRLIMLIGFPAAGVIVFANEAQDPAWALVWLSASRFWFMFAYTVLITYGMEAVPEEQTALMNGVLNATFGVTNLIVSPMFGRMSDRYGGYQEVIWLVAMAPLVGLAVWLVLSHLATRQNHPA